MTPEQISKHISAMRDSVWVIQEQIPQDLSKGLYLSVQRNVEHLNIMMNDPEISESGEDLSDVVESIRIGEEFLLNNSYILSSNPTE